MAYTISIAHLNSHRKFPSRNNDGN